jgi:ATP-dependent Clp protease ATP-binding subunit ClpA
MICRYTERVATSTTRRVLGSCRSYAITVADIGNRGAIAVWVSLMATDRRYSQHARRAMTHARLLAKKHAHPFVDSSHLLIGILHEGGSVGYSILQELEMDLRRTERAFRQLPRKTSSATTDTANLPLTETLRDSLALAADEAHWLGQHYIGTEHILLGICRGSEESLLTLLHMFEISPEQIRRRARRLLQEGITEISVEQAKRVARLSELSRRTLNAAEQIAEQMGHKHVGLAHLLLVLSGERRSICARLLRESGLDAAALEGNLIKPRPATGGMLEDVIDRAVDRAESLGSHYTGTDHLLLSLAQNPRGARLLRKYGVNPQALAKQLRVVLSS